MADKTVYADCPHCKARLEVDSKTGKVVQSWEKPGLTDGKDAFKEALRKQKEDKAKLDIYFKGAGSEMKKKKKELEEKFKKEKERIHKEKDYSRPESPFDLD